MRIQWPRAKSSAVASVTQRLRPGASTNVLAALDLFGGAAIIVDREWRVVFQNNAAARRSGTITVEAVNAQLWQAWPAEEELRRRASLLDHAYDAILVWDWDGSITDWNRGAERLCGYAEQEAVGRISHRLLRTRHPEAVEQFLRDLERDGLWEGELERTRRDGKTIYVNTRHILVREQNHRYVLEANRDVTSRKHGEARATI